MKPTTAIFILAYFLLTSCATILTGTKDMVRITSKPEGATVFVNGIERGQTPTTVILKRKILGGEYITLEKEGYETRQFQPETNFNGVAALNLFSALFWAIDIASGAIVRYNPKYYNLELRPIKKSDTQL